MVKEVKNMDELLPEVLEYCLEKNRRLDIAKIQATFQIGYPRASRIVDQMIEMGAARELDDFSKELIVENKD